MIRKVRTLFKIIPPFQDISGPLRVGNYLGHYLNNVLGNFLLSGVHMNNYKFG